MEAEKFKEIEEKWQKKWKEIGLYKTPDKPRNKFYLLEMFAYPSGDIHIGHFRNYTLGDVVWRYKRMQGFQILHPFGWDAFGLPAEQAAITHKESPYKWTMNNISRSKDTLKKLGISYDWQREVVTCDPDYYKWTQWIFLKLYEKGLCYRAHTFVNWCPVCKTVLANEQVVQGRCWRCHSPVEKKETEQWFIKITDYAERLLNGIDKLEGYPENVRTIQRNWIGRSEGCEIIFKLENTNINLPVFTTRPDTIYGVTFIVIAPEHKVLKEMIQRSSKKKDIEDYIKKSLMKTEIERTDATKEKDGVFTGLYAINPFSNEKVEVWVADYVLASYGTGIVMAVPAHDQRDFEFARKYHIPIKVVINPVGKNLKAKEMSNAYTEAGVMVNSGPFSGMDSISGISKAIEYMEERGFGKRKVTYRIRDWLISRQRYWGAPIPIIHCDKCGIVPVPEDDLPVLLPDESKVDFIPKGRSPLEDVPEFYNVKCPKCGGEAKRDVDTIDTFLDSSWYYLRYLSPKENNVIFKKEEAKKWLPVDLYIGGIEHAAGHLIYYRFISMFLYDLGLVESEEPAIKLFNQGMVLDEKGEVMSKSKGNVVSPRALIDKEGVDVSRIALLFFAPPGREILWQEKGLKGARRFLGRFYTLAESITKYDIDLKTDLMSEKENDLYRAVEQTTKRVTVDIERMDFNTAIAALMELLNTMYLFTERELPVFQYALMRFTVLLAPFAPHFAEEVYSRFGKYDSVFYEAWPVYDKSAIVDEEVTIVIQVNGKVRSRVQVPVNTEEDRI
ncbi:MAG: leucine--tRNA ligase, partial [Candidatus Cloacimonas sp. 4484_209]